MTVLQAIILGIVQGLTEFIPVSSSGHLMLVPWLLGWPAPSLAFDVSVHVGTLLALLVFFWRDWLSIAQATINAIRQRSLADSEARLLLLLILATLPAALAGYLLEDFFEAAFKTPTVAAAFLLVTALLLMLGERLSNSERDIAKLTWLNSLLIGVAQASALFPGLSRSGATIAAGRWQGFSRQAAARFSFLLATPIVFGAGLLNLIGLAGSGKLAGQGSLLLSGLVTSSIVGYAAISWLMRYLQHKSLLPFAIYCAIVGSSALVLSIMRAAV